jgi:hypothetical protein
MAKKTLTKKIAPTATTRNPTRHPTRNPQRRKFTRYAADPGDFALILSDNKGQKLPAPIPCLIVEESYGGCGLVTTKIDLIKKGAQLELQVGKLAKMRGEIRWTRILENKILYFGVAYLEP